MAKKLDWRSFEVHEDQAAYGEKRFAELSPVQRIKRFFEVWDMTRMIGSIKHQPEGFILKRK